MVATSRPQSAAVEPPALAATESGVPPGDRSLERALREDSTGFDFFRAVHLLERLRPDRDPVGGWGDPADEAVRFSVNPSIAFPTAEIQSLELPQEGAAEDGQARMSVNFMGLTGPLGVLPHHYTLLVSERLRDHDSALGDFFDLFHHRLVSLFYRAWEKFRFSAAVEKGESDRLAEHTLDLVGVGVAGHREHLAVPEAALVFYAGLLGPQPRSAAALEQLLEAYFRVPVEIEQFVGGWYALSGPDQCALGDAECASNQLGFGAVAGDEVWDQQARVRIRLGPLTRRQFDDFLPTGSAHATLRALTRFYSHDQFDFEVQLILARDEVPSCVLGAETPFAQPLGWSTWIRSAPFARDADEAIFRL